jgi:peptide/nickel transport system substrate-binding protein
VEFTVKRAMDPNTAMPTIYMLGDIIGAKAEGEDTVHYDFRKPFVPVFVGLGMAYHSVISPTAVEKWGDEYGRHPTGTGPYKLVSWKGDDIVLERNEEHTWASPIYFNPGLAYLDKLNLRTILEHEARIIALETKEIDMMFGYDFPLDKLPLIESIDGVKVYKSFSYALWLTYMNTIKDPFTDVRVRIASEHAIDKAALVEFVCGGMATAQYSLLSEPFFGHDPKYDKTDGYFYDPDKAIALLTEAGYPNGFATTYLVDDAARDRKMAQVQQAQWKKVGIECEIFTMPLAELLAKAPSAEHGYAWLGYVYNDPDILYQFFYPGEFVNWSFYENDRLAEVLDLQREAFDPEERKALIYEAQQILHDNCPAIPLFMPFDNVVPHRDYVHDAYMNWFGFVHFSDIWTDIK